MAKRQSFADKVSKKKHETICPACGNAVTFTRMVRAIPKDSGGYKMKSVTVGIIKCAHRGDQNCLVQRHNIMSEQEANAVMN